MDTPLCLYSYQLFLSRMPSLSFLLASNRDIQIVIKIVFVFFQKFKIHLIGRLSLVFQVGNLTGDAGTIPLLQRLEAI